MEKPVHKYITQSEKWHSEIFTSHSIEQPDINIKTVKNFNAILKLSGTWDNVVLNSSRATIYQTFEWLYNWWNYLAAGQPNLLHILLISSSEKLVGIAPLYIHKYSFGGFIIYRQLKLIGSGLNCGASLSNAIEEHGISDYLDIIALDGYEKKVADAVVSYLHDYNNFFDEIDFQNVSEESFISEWLLHRLRRKNFGILITKTDTCPRLQIPCSINIYLESLRASTRRKCRQIQRQAGKYPGIEIIKVEGTNFLNSVQTLKRLHQSRWNELGHLGLFSDKRFEEFILRTGKIFFDKGWLWFKEVKLNNKIVAVRLAYKFKDKIYDYLSGFDYDHFRASFRPGITLIFSMIEDAVSHNYRTVDFLRGAEEYKYEFSSDECYNYNILILRPDSTSWFRRALFYLVKARIKMMFRIKTESALIKLQMRRRGKIMFLIPYLRFCLSRLKIFTAKKKTKNLKEEKSHQPHLENNLPGPVTEKNKNYIPQRIEESTAHYLQSPGSENEIAAVKK